MVVLMVVLMVVEDAGRRLCLRFRLAMTRAQCLGGRSDGIRPTAALWLRLRRLPRFERGLVMRFATTGPLVK